MAPTKNIEHNTFAGERASLDKIHSELRGKSRTELLRVYAGLQMIKEGLQGGSEDPATQKEAGLSSPGGRHNFMWLLDEAVAKDQETMSRQELIDSKTTQLATDNEANIYKFWYGEGGVLDKDQAAVKAEVDKNKPNDSGTIEELTEQYRTDTAESQSATSQADGGVQGDQGQTSADATNQQMKAQMLQSVNQLQSSLAQLMQQLMGGGA